MPLQATSGAASYDAFGGGAAAVTPYIEDVFSTYLYDPTGSSLTITNGIDLSGKGGLVWLKNRTVAADHYLYDTVRGATAGNAKYLVSNSTAAQSSGWPNSLAVTNSGFTLGSQAATPGEINNFGYPVVSWTFREAPKFFDVVTYTGDGNAGLQINHALGSVPGCIIVKNTSNSGSNWCVYHRGFNGGVNPEQYFAFLNTTAAQAAATVLWNDTAPTSTNFTVGTAAGVNSSGNTYVAYLFAHNAGGFGLTGTDNVISCGSYTGNGSSTGPITSLGYEPQWVLIKKSSGGTIGAGSSDWTLFDTMRGLSDSDRNDNYLNPNLSAEENGLGNGNFLRPLATGFQPTDGSDLTNQNGSTYIYVAIRRGPMKVPTDATKVFNPYITTSVANSGTTYTSANLYNIGFVADVILQRNSSGTDGWYIGNRLQDKKYLKTETTAAEVTTAAFVYDSNIGAAGYNSSYGLYAFKRAPSYMDVVSYSGTGTTTTQTHNLQAVPELIIVKRRSDVAFWQVYSATYGRDYYAFLNDTQGFASDPGNSWGTTNPTSTTFSLSPLTETNASGSTYVAYLFATCAGVSKVGSYTGNGSTQTINCGFGAGGARFVLIKRADASGGWYVYDTARGMTVLTDPYLFLNTTAAESATLGSVTTVSTGFALNSTILAAINVSGGTYIFLAIA
jgi:hypothetical protein